MNRPPDAEAPRWSRDPADLLAALGTTAGGLPAAEAARRLGQYGPNVVDEPQQLTTLRLFVRQFSSPLVLILVLGALVSLYLRDWVDAAIILAIVLGSCLLGFTQEHRASSAIAALRKRLALNARVLRDGVAHDVAVRSIVPGDVILLSAGNLVPADGLVLEARDFLVSESSLTGESFPVEKSPGRLPAGTPLPARTNCVYAGTSVRSGSATVLVVETGTRTEFGAVAARLRDRAPETDFAQGVRHFGYLLLRAMLVTVIFVLSVNQLLGRPVLDSLLFAVALAVGLTPELLPAVVSVMLSKGAREMARRGVIVRRLDAIENLGSMDVLCTDKTGTLTSGVIALDAAVDPDGQPDAGVLRLAWLNAAFETGIDNPLDAAIVARGEREGCTTAGHAKIDEIPYDFIRRRLTVVVADRDDPGHHRIVTKGAWTQVLEICTTLGDAPLDATRRARIDAWFEERSAQGFRILAVATKRVAARDRYGHADEAGMSLAGFLLFFDPPKPQAAQTLRELATLGIRTKVITGDNRHVAAHVARAIGLDPGAMLTGAQIAAMKDESLWQKAPQTDLFVEVDPQQKERIVRALQRTGHSVGFLGDGINDAPALHAADVGISVDTAVDVARESADVVLLRPDLDAVRVGVAEGRRTFANTLKYINITTSANLGNMISMALATPLLPFLPLAAKQILLNNFLSDLPLVTVSTDRVDASRITRPQRWDMAAVRRFILVFGLLSTAFDLLTFAVLIHVFEAGEADFQTAWFVVSLLTEIAVVMVLRTDGPALRSRPGRLLLATSLAVAVVAFALPYVPPVARALGFVALPAGQMAAVVLIVAGYIAVTEAAKLVLYGKAR